MKNKLKQEKGITMVALVIIVITLLILTSVLIYNANDRVYVRAITNLNNDISLLREKISEYYEEYGKVPAKLEYTNIDHLASALSKNNDIGKFYVIDLEAMQGITLNYGKDYETIKNDESNCNNYTDVYIINENSHNIFYVEGIQVKEDNTMKIYYTDYTTPDETYIDLRYIDGILIPEGYYYIGKAKDEEENEAIVISSNKDDTINDTDTNQYTWTKQGSKIVQTPIDVELESTQSESSFIKSVNAYKGYFKNTEGKVVYTEVNEDNWSNAYTKDLYYTDEEGEKVFVPAGCKISLAPTMNKVKKGFVIKDKNDNEWVWIPVPSEEVFTTAKNSSDYDNIKNDLITYVSEYSSEDDTSTEDYKKMLSSLYIHGGFWISRYEIGDSSSTTLRTNSSGTTGKPVSKPNQIPYNYIKCSEAQNLANDMKPNSNRTSSLLFGLQWDLVCKYLNNKTDFMLEDDVNLNEWSLELLSNDETNQCVARGILNESKYSFTNKNGYTTNYMDENIGFRVAMY